MQCGPRRWWAVLRLALAVALVSVGARGAAPVLVVATDRAAPELQQPLIEAVSSQLAELGVEVVLSAVPAASAGPDGSGGLGADREVLAFVWIERVPDALVVHFYEPAGASLRERRIPVTGIGAASLEEVAIVIRSAASALLERPAPSPPSPPPAPVPPVIAAPAPPPVAPRSPWAEATLAYAGTLYDTTGSWQHGVRLGLSARWTSPHWRLAAAFTWLPPLRVRSSEAGIVLHRHPIELGIGYEIPLGRGRVALRPEGLLGADAVRRRTDWASVELVATEPATRWSWSATTALTLVLRPSPSMGLFGSLGTDFLLNRVEQAADRVTLVEPLRVRPRLLAGLSLGLP